jgi:DNA polymerase III gamma/tau subunit
MGAHAKSFSTSDVLRMMRAFNNAAVDLRGGWQPSLGLELALAEVLDAPNVSTPPPIAPPSSSGTIRAKPQPAPVPPVSSPVERKEGGTKSGQTSEARERAANLTSQAEAPALSPAEKSAINAGEVIKVWKHLSASLPKAQANLSALLNSVRMIDMQGKTLILGLASDVLVSKIDKPDQIEVIRKLIKDYFGEDVNIRCVVTNAKGKIPPNVSQDGMVAAAIQHGGEIVDMQD